MNSVETAINALKQGKMILLTDPMDRENEGDFVFPAEIITPEVMRFMIHHGTGIVCFTLPEEHLKRLELPLMVPEHQNKTRHNTPFTLPVDAKEGITTGVSAADRTRTVQVMMDPEAKPSDLVRPGHMYPLQARSGGVLERNGHTEGALDIVKLAGFKPGAVICEAIHPNGTMVKGKDLLTLAKEHNLVVLSIDDLITYRLSTENLIDETAKAFLPTEKYGDFEMSVIKEKYTHLEHTVLYQKPKENNKPLLVRIHSCCQTGDLFGSLRCDCQKQLEYSLEKIQREGGILIYLNQEGRGIGLLNKIKAYALQEKGMDTVQANLELGFSADSRSYAVVPSILRQMNIQQIRLLTNNPQKINELKKYGFSHVEREAMPVFENPKNKQYLSTKKERLNHQFSEVI
jgi:3,4-dihydroxy 2-butanone 4-phosphate synthase / GTP cyclohydrolase II